MKSLIAAGLVGFLSLSSHAAFVGIHAAAADGDVAELKKDLADDPKSISSRNGAGRTPLCVAAMRGQTNAVEFLISQGADVNDKGFQEMTPLADMASAWGLRNDEKCAEVAKILIEHAAKTDPVDVYGKTPLLWAAEAGKPQLTQLLLEKGANVATRVRTGGGRGRTALHLAVENHQKEVVEVLLKFKAPLDLVESSGWTPLDLAERLGPEETADLIRAAEAEASGRQIPKPPSREAMRALARRIADGYEGAFDELSQIAGTLYNGIDYQKEHSRVMANMYRMKTAFDVLGQEAGKGNTAAFQALKKSLGMKHLGSFAPDAFGIAAAAGNKESLDMLLHYKQWGILESTAVFAFAEPVKAGVDPAIDWAAAWLSHIKPHQSAGMVMSTTNALAAAAAKGNQKAQDTLEKFAAAAAEPDR